MPEQFVVPQFLDTEAKIIGPITARQFLILLATVLAEFLIYRIFLSIIAIIALGVPVLAGGIIIAFVKVNGRPVHYIALNMIQTFRKPMLRVWDKTVDTRTLKAQLREKVVKQPAPVIPKKRLIEKSRLGDIALVVNTGGVYHPDE
ncbi:PrgI family protein [Candidatus Uhrbacteria bacterium]|jgi:hypothetical protein|nr:PrgI family protein [Candidatus Uhrbacteria bacterium]